MCQAFSCIITKRGKVFYKVGLDSHDLILDEFKIRDMDDQIEKDKLKFARVEIIPVDGYLHPENEWKLQIDEDIKPTWWNDIHEKKAFIALEKWKEKVYSSLKLEKARNPLNPFTLSPREVTTGDIDNLKRCASVRDSVCDSVWDSVGASVGASVWASVRDSIGDSVWDSVWASVGDSVGDSVCASVWDSVGDSVWDSIGDSVWDSVGAYIGSMFSNSKNWKYSENIETPKGDYPYQCFVNLWERGFVPSFDGETWRLHTGEDAQIVYGIKI